MTIQWGTLKTADDLNAEILKNKADQLRSERDRLIESVEWRVKRYEQQKLLSITTTDSYDVYCSVLNYIQSLRDITEQSDFPLHVEWPRFTL